MGPFGDGLSLDSAKAGGLVDTLSKTERSERMRRIRGKDTSPERRVRSILHRMGYRFRLHAKDLPGRPDIVLPRHSTVVQVHGCFWHRHRGCRYATRPSTRRAFWEAKFDANVARDRRVSASLRRLGWWVITVWECQLRKPERVAARLERLLAAGELVRRSCRQRWCKAPSEQPGNRKHRKGS